MPRRRLTSAQSAMGRAARSDAANRSLWAIYLTLRTISREEELAPTLGGIADQLNTRGLRTTRGNPFDARKVYAALTEWGVDRVAVERWKKQAREKAVLWNMPLRWLIHQLWHEWQYHHRLIYLRFAEASPFSPILIHPFDWTPPWHRDKRVELKMMPTLPATRVVHLLLGAFDDIPSVGVNHL